MVWERESLLRLPVTLLTELKSPLSKANASASVSNAKDDAAGDSASASADSNSPAWIRALRQRSRTRDPGESRSFFSAVRSSFSRSAPDTDLRPSRKTHKSVSTADIAQRPWCSRSNHL